MIATRNRRDLARRDGPAAQGGTCRSISIIIIDTSGGPRRGNTNVESLYTRSTDHHFRRHEPAKLTGAGGDLLRKAQRGDGSFGETKGIRRRAEQCFRKFVDV